MAQAPTPTPTPQGSWLRQQLNGRSVGTVLGLAVLLIFIVQNTEDVKFHFLAADFSWPMWLYTIVVAFIGAMVWFGLGVRRRHRRRKDRREERREERA